MTIKAVQRDILKDTIETSKGSSRNVQVTHRKAGGKPETKRKKKSGGKIKWHD